MSKLSIRVAQFASGLVLAAGVMGCPEPTPEPEAQGDAATLADVDTLCMLSSRGEYLYETELRASGQQRCAIGATEPPDRRPAWEAEAQAVAEAACAADGQNRALLEDALTGGRVVIHMDVVRACDAWGEALKRGEERDRTDKPCDGMIEGQVAVGGTCVQAWDCAGDAICAPGADNATVLTCQAPGTAGATCETDATKDRARGRGAPECAAGLSCVDGLCAPLGAAGATCGTGQAPCDADTYCKDGTCAAREPAGGVCAAESHCQTGLKCQADVCTPDVPVPTGEACDPEGLPCADPCASCHATTAGGDVFVCALQGEADAACDSSADCRLSLTCAANGRCVAPAAANASCADRACADGLFCACPGNAAACDDAAQVCSPRIAPGGACSTDNQLTGGCDQGYCFDGTCHESALGAPCHTADVCPLGATCTGNDTTAGVCATDPVLGEACSTSRPCAEGYCAASGTCMEQGAPGDGCSEDAACESGLCLDDGTCAAGVGESCLTTRGYFPNYILLSMLGLWFVRRRRARA